MPANTTSSAVNPINRRSTAMCRRCGIGEGRLNAERRSALQPASDNGCGAAQQRENQPFDGELPDDARAAGAERRANTDLALAIRCAREEERRDVEAGDEQDDADNREPDPRNRREARSFGVAIGHRREDQRPRPCLLTGCWAPSPVAMLCRSAPACAAETPGARRPTTVSQGSLRSRSRAGMLQRPHAIEGNPEVRFE